MPSENDNISGEDEQPYTLEKLRRFYDARFYAAPADVDTERHFGILLRYAERLAGEALAATVLRDEALTFARRLLADADDLGSYTDECMVGLKTELTALAGEDSDVG